MTNQRKSDYPIHEMFLNRWSRRAFAGQHDVLEVCLLIAEKLPLQSAPLQSRPTA